MGRRLPRNPPRIVGDMAYIDLGNGREAIIDAEDLERVVAAGPWYASSRRRKPGAKVFIYAQNYSRRKPPPHYLHRLILGNPSGKSVDHINHDTLDCRKANLRTCTTAENLRNASGPMSTNTSGVRGVYWHHQAGKWHGQAKANGKIYSAGVHDHLDDAEQAVMALRNKLHGEFAYDSRS